MEQGVGTEARTLRGRSARGKRRTVPACTLAALLGAALVLGCQGAPAAPATSPSAPSPAQGRALASLAWRALELLPAAAVAPPPARTAPAFEAPQRPGDASFAIGPTNAGALVGPVALPEDLTSLAVRPVTRSRGATHGTRALVALLSKAAQRVAREHPGSVLWVGDLSRAEGGPLPPHRSHTNGRDVDLAFYVSRDGRDGPVPADQPAMVRADASGRIAGSRDLFFDRARNWALVRALLEDPGVVVQWIFVADHLRALLIDHARQVAPPALVARAERVLAQPKDSSPHDDHFHVRIYCGLEERLQGCLDAPPWHPWAPRHEAELARWLDGLLPFLETPREPETREAIERIVRMNATNAIVHLERLVEEPLDAELRLLAHDALGFLRRGYTREAWKRWRAEEAP